MLYGVGDSPTPYFCTMKIIIPLFPLHLVIFPESRYPLHIFEPRYKILIKESLERDTGFGIVARFGDKISDVCTYVKVEKVIKRYPGGESDIIVRGISRYLIEKVELHPVGYLTATVEPYDDITEIKDHNKEIQLIILFEEFLSKLNFSLPEEYWESLRNSRNKSFKLAEKAGLTIEQQQEFLIIRSENLRLNFLIDHLNNLEKRYSQQELIQKLIIQDGYLNETKE